MHRLRPTALTLIALLTAVTLVAGACGSDDSASSKKTTTTESSKKSTTTDGGSSTTTTLSPSDWDAAASAAQDRIKAAAGDVCALLAASQNLNLPNPTTAEQGKRSVELLSLLLNEVADTAPAENAKEAATIRKTVTELQAEGEKTNYSADFLGGPKSLESQEFGAAMQTFGQVASQRCATTSSTTVAP